MLLDDKDKKPGFQVDDEGNEPEKKTESPEKGESGGKEQPGAGADDSDKGEKLYTKEDVSKMIAGRLGDDKYRKIVDRIAKNAGISVDEMEKKLDDVETELSTRQIQAQAKQLGVDPRVLGALAHMSAKLESQEIGLQIKDMENNKKDFPDFKEYKNEILDKAKKHGLTLEDAYWMVAGRTRSKQSARETEHRMENSRQKQSGKDRIQGDDSSSFGTSGDKIPDDVVAMAKRIGEDPQEYYDSMMSKDIDEYRERKARRNKNKK